MLLTQCMFSSSEMREDGTWVLFTQCMFSSSEVREDGTWVLLTHCMFSRSEMRHRMDRTAMFSRRFKDIC